MGDEQACNMLADGQFFRGGGADGGGPAVEVEQLVGQGDMELAVGEARREGDLPTRELDLGQSAELWHGEPEVEAASLVEGSLDQVEERRIVVHKP
ncbi:hypothetical protein [Actinosynnema sp. NPDC023587]|uniref:hypothetical protein n=1 Tax=Actinosynnema sp. NPDC023587 TaxID=3154695 RepID=UPI0033E3C7EA